MICGERMGQRCHLPTSQGWGYKQTGTSGTCVPGYKQQVLLPEQVPVSDTALSTALGLVRFDVSPLLRGGVGTLQPQVRKAWKHGLQTSMQPSRMQKSFKKSHILKLVSL